MNAGTEVVLLDAHSNLGVQVVHSLHEGGYRRVTAVSMELRNRLRFSRCCRHVLAEGWDWTMAPEALERVVGGRAGAVLMPMTTAAVRWCLRHRVDLSGRWRLTPLPEAGVFERVNDKAGLGLVCAAAGLRFPRTYRLGVGGEAGGEGVEAFVRAVGFPLLLKPVRGSGGMGLVEIGGEAALRTVLAGLGEPGGHCLQEWVGGREVSCGWVGLGGRVLALAVYEPLTRRGRFGVCRSLQVVVDDEAARVVSRLSEQLGWDGPANVDLRCGADGVYRVLDFNPRPWGSMRSLLGAGVNFPVLLCRLALGEEPGEMGVVPMVYRSPGDALRGVMAGGWKGAVGPGVEVFTGWRHVWRDPGLYLAMGVLSALGRWRG